MSQKNCPKLTRNSMLLLIHFSNEISECVREILDIRSIPISTSAHYHASPSIEPSLAHPMAPSMTHPMAPSMTLPMAPSMTLPMAPAMTLPMALNIPLSSSYGLIQFPFPCMNFSYVDSRINSRTINEY